MSGSTVRVLMLNTSDRWARNGTLYRKLINQHGFKTKICNSMKMFRKELKRRPELIFVPGDQRGMRVCRNVIKDGSHTINMYDASPKNLARAMHNNPAVLGLNTKRL